MSTSLSSANALGDYQENVDFTVPFYVTDLPVGGSFVDRPAETKQLEDAVSTESKPTTLKTCAVRGKSGIGKTELVADFVRRNQHKYSAVFWLDGSTKEALRRSTMSAMRRLPLHRETAPTSSGFALAKTKLENFSSALWEWLGLDGNNRWLLVIDNFDDEHVIDVEEVLSRRDQGTIIITTQLTSLHTSWSNVVLSTVPDQVAKVILAFQAGQKITDVEGLVAKLGGLPLALVQAGSFIRETKKSIPEYLVEYDQVQANLIQKGSFREQIQSSNDPSVPSEDSVDDSSVLVTWSMCYKQIAAEHPQAAKLLDIWAFLDKRDLWYELMTVTPPECLEDDDVWRLEGGGASLHKILHDLSRYALIIKNGDSEEYKIHSVLHNACQHNVYSMAKRGHIFRCAVRMVQAMAMALGASTPSSPRLVPHARMIAHHCPALGDDDSIANSLYRVAYFLSDWEFSHEVEYLYEEAIRRVEIRVGPDHVPLYGALHNLAQTYEGNGKPAKAEATMKRALAGYEKTIGPEHLSTLSTVNSLGTMYSRQERWEEAEALFRRVLAGREALLGPDHKEVLLVVHNLGQLYESCDRFEEAETMLKRALDGYEKDPSSDETDKLMTRSSLGLMYCNQGKTDAAEEILQKTLAEREQVDSIQNDSTIKVITNLALVYRKQGRLDESIRLFLQLLEAQETMVGPNHSSTIDTLHNLGVLYSEQGQLDAAEVMFDRAIAGFEMIWGAEHSITVDAMVGLGLVYMNQEQMGKAEAIWIKAKDILENTIGLDNRAALHIFQNLGCLYSEAERLTDAKAMYQRALEGKERVLGPQHPLTIDTVQAFSRLYSDEGRTVEAEAMYMRAFQERHQMSSRSRESLEGLEKLLRKRNRKFEVTGAMAANAAGLPKGKKRKLETQASESSYI